MPKLFLLLVAAVFLPAVASAQISPDEFVKGMFGEYKTEGSAHAFLKYVHWQTAFAELSPTEKAIRGVNSGDDLHKQYEDFYANPGEFLEKVMEPKTTGLTSEKRAEVEAQLRQITAAMALKADQLKQQATKNEYEVGEAKIKGEQALVEIISKSGSVTEQGTVLTAFINGKWWLPDLSAIRLKGVSVASPPTPVAAPVSSSSGASSSGAPAEPSFVQ